MERYIYDGPVINNFGKIISNEWRGETYAVSNKKAISNLCYQFRRQNGFIEAYKVKLPNKLLVG